MFIKSCSRCGRKPTISEGVLHKNGDRFYTIHCPNYCSTLKPHSNGPYDFNNTWSIWVQGENPDYNTIYKKWNELIV